VPEPTPSLGDNGHYQNCNPLQPKAPQPALFDHYSSALLSSEEQELDPALLAEIWTRRAYDLAEEPPSEVKGDTLNLLVFNLGGEQYGIEVANVREIYPLEQLTPVPRTPDFVAGVFSARGRILSVIDLRAFLGLPTTSNNAESQTKIMVVTNTDPTSDNMDVGVLADEVVDVVTIFRDELEPPLSTQAGVHADYIYGLTTDLLVVLNLNALLSDKRLIVHEEIT
jgi:purine-binding chemotaxis protein CheW